MPSMMGAAEVEAAVVAVVAELGASSPKDMGKVMAAMKVCNRLIVYINIRSMLHVCVCVRACVCTCEVAEPGANCTKDMGKVTAAMKVCT